MLAWKSIYGILPKRLHPRVFIIRQCSAFPVVFRNREVARNGDNLLVCRESARHSLRFLSSSSKKSEERKESSVFQELVESHEKPQTELTVGAKVAQAGKDVSYFGIILVGFAVTGVLIWFVVSELFFGFSANRVYASALKKVKASAEVLEAVGEPIMGHGETTSRGRRRHVSYQEYLVDGENYMRVKFYLKGSKRKGTVHVDVKQGSRGNFDYRFIFVELTGFPSETIVVLDNR